MCLHRHAILNHRTNAAISRDFETLIRQHDFNAIYECAKFGSKFDCNYIFKADNDRPRHVLHYSIKSMDNIDFCRWLVKNGADVNKRLNKDELTSLMIASQYNTANSKIVAMLIENNANINDKIEKSGATALMIACTHITDEKFKIIQMLINSDVNVNDIDLDYGFNALFWCCYYKNTFNISYNDIQSSQAAQLLIENNINLRHTDNDGRTALIYSSVKYNMWKIKNSSILEIMIEAMSQDELNIKDKYGYTALDYLVLMFYNKMIDKSNNGEKYSVIWYELTLKRQIKTNNVVKLLFQRGGRSGAVNLSSRTVLIN